MEKKLKPKVDPDLAFKEGVAEQINALNEKIDKLGNAFAILLSKGEDMGNMSVVDQPVSQQPQGRSIGELMRFLPLLGQLGGGEEDPFTAAMKEEALRGSTLKNNLVEALIDRVLKKGMEGLP